jgi:rare lipoprotein A (peptidoglycan hydrolase)
MPIAFSQHARRASLRPFASRASLPGALAALAGALAALALSPACAAAASTSGDAGTSGAAAAPLSGRTTTAPTTGATSSGGAAPIPLTRKATIATWFGPGFYGSTTACGQKMTPALVGVASRTLPCGTLVQIGYRGHRLTVPVLDRGPYGHIGAMWDLTAGTAHALGITETVRVHTTVVGSVANTPTLGEPAPGSEAANAPSAPSATAAATGGAAAH